MSIDIELVCHCTKFCSIELDGDWKHSLGVFRKDLAVKLTFILRPKASLVKISGTSVPGGEISEMEMGLGYCKIQRWPVYLTELERQERDQV